MNDQFDFYESPRRSHKNIDPDDQHPFYYGEEEDNNHFGFLTAFVWVLIVYGFCALLWWLMG